MLFEQGLAHAIGDGLGDDKEGPPDRVVDPVVGGAAQTQALAPDKASG